MQAGVLPYSNASGPRSSVRVKTELRKVSIFSHRPDATAHVTIGESRLVKPLVPSPPARSICNRGKSPRGFADAGVERVVSTWKRQARRGACTPAALNARGYGKTPPGSLQRLRASEISHKKSNEGRELDVRRAKTATIVASLLSTASRPVDRPD